MAERSVSVAVEAALADPQTLSDMKADPAAALKRLEAQTLQQLPPPDADTTSKIWLVVVSAFVLVMVGTALSLGIGVFTKLQADATYATRGDTMLTVFTTVVGFLAGLLSPSPVNKK